MILQLKNAMPQIAPPENEGNSTLSVYDTYLHIYDKPTSMIYYFNQQSNYNSRTQKKLLKSTRKFKQLTKYQ